MDTLNIHAAKTHFSGLVERAEKGETIIIARAGTPVARLTPLEPDKTTPANRRYGFLAGEINLDPNFDIKAFGREEIDAMFFGDPET